MSRVCCSRVSTCLKISLNHLKCSTRALAVEVLGEKHTNKHFVRKMEAWQIHSYGDVSELQFTNKARVPQITSPNEVLVKVEAASVNPLDTVMVQGYGRSLFNFLRPRDTIEFPLTLGRDFSGVVVNKGLSVGSDLSIGDSVWGVVAPASQGSHAEYVLVDKNSISVRPPKLTHIEAASILYTGLTAYSGLMSSGGMSISGMKEKRILVLGAAGGVGSMAVQILKAGGATVICSCSSDAQPLLTSLGVDIVLDRRSEDFAKQVVDNGPYDTILDCAGLGPDYASKYEWKYKKFITFTTPLLRNFDEAGIVGGFFKNACNIAGLTFSGLWAGKSTRWAYFVPSAKGIEHLTNLVRQNQLKPVVSKVFTFDKVPDAFKEMMGGHSRGKIVIDIMNKSTDKAESTVITPPS